MRFSLRWRWMIWHLLIGGIVLLFMIIYLGSRLESYFDNRFELRIKQELHLAKEFVAAKHFTNLTLDEADLLADEIAILLNKRITLITKDGKVVGDSEISLKDLPDVENHGNHPEVRDAMSLGFGESRRLSSTIDLDLVYFAVPVDTQDIIDGIVRMAVPVSEIEDSTRQIYKLIWLSGGIGLILALLIGVFVSKSMTRSISDMSDAANRIAQGDFSKKIDLPNRNDEIADLGSSLNRMSEDLQQHLHQITLERDQLQAILDSMVEGVTVTDLDGRIILFNRSFQNIFRLLDDAVLKKPMQEIIQNKELLHAIELVITEKQNQIVSLELKELTFSKIFEAHISLLGSKSKPSGIVLVFHDITRLKHLEIVRRDFVANVSHEIRTPLTAIKGYTETLLENQSFDHKSNEFLQIIMRHTDQMSKLVVDLLRLSKLESIESDLQEEIDLAKIVADVISEHFENINQSVQKRCKLEVKIPKLLPKIVGESSELETVFENLIENAIKYGQKGTNLISISAIELENEIQVDVSDEGIGIPPGDLSRIFERFYRVAKGRTKVMGGTGLGLSIVKHIVQRHGGKIWVKSDVGIGSVFSFTLPKS